MSELFNVLVSDINYAFELKESLKKNEKIEEVEFIPEKIGEHMYYNIAYTLKKA